MIYGATIVTLFSKKVIVIGANSLNSALIKYPFYKHSFCNIHPEARFDKQILSILKKISQGELVNLSHDVINNIVHFDQSPKAKQNTCQQPKTYQNSKKPKTKRRHFELLIYSKN